MSSPFINLDENLSMKRMLDRRDFLRGTSSGFGSLALAMMLQEEGYADGAVKVLHHPPKAKRVVQLFMGGAASHIDLWDHKPMLEKSTLR